MKRLVKKAEEQEDRFLGSPIEIINVKSKYNGYLGWIDDKYHNEKYKVLIKPMYERDGKEWLPMYIDYHQIERWVQVISKELLED